MSAPQITAEIDAFLASYRSAFEDFDVSALAGFFAYPCQFSSDGKPVNVSVINNEREYVQAVARIISLYRSIGVSTGVIEDRLVTTLSEKLTVVHVKWRILNLNHRELYEFCSVYTLLRTVDGWRIGAIAHNEIPRLQRILANPPN